MEDDSRYKKTTEEEVSVTEKPQFGRPLKNVEHLPEGKLAHLEATLTPVNDPTMKVEWFRNGRPIPQGNYLIRNTIFLCLKVLCIFNKLIGEECRFVCTDPDSRA